MNADEALRRVRGVYWSGVPFFVAAVVLAIAGRWILPSYLPWLGAAMLVWAGFKVRARTSGWTLGKARKGWHFQRSSGPRWKDLRPGEELDEPVILTQVPNVALGEILCSRLRKNGIEAYYRGANLGGGDAIGIADMNPLLPAEILVGAHHLEQARRLLDEP